MRYTVSSRKHAKGGSALARTSRDMKSNCPARRVLHNQHKTDIGG